MQYIRQFFEMLLYPLHALLNSPGSLSNSARRLTGASLPARISLLTFLFLILVWAAAFLAWFFKDSRTSKYLPGSLIVVALILAIVIPIVLYYVLRLWMEGESSRYPDIDFAWKAGMNELRNQGIELEYTPLFLVLGSPGELYEKSIMNCTRRAFRVAEIPVGTAALHWYADPDGIYLVCTEVSCLSRLALMARRANDESRAAGGATIPGAPRPAVDVRGTLMTDPSEDSVEAPPKPTSGTMMFPPTPERTVSRSGTIMFDADDHDNPTQPPTERKQVVLSQDEQHEEEQRLRYLCRLIIKHRQPLAPINGVLTLLPFSIVQTGRREGSELQRVIRNDVRTLVDTLRLRCPVISLVVGMEEESGFREMVRRMGRDAAREQRIGKGYSVGNPSTPEQLEALSAHACAWFEGQIYRLFGERGALAKPGNTKLYALLCKIRRMVRTPLTNILVNGYAEDASEKRGVAQEPLFFSGCYFAAAGEVEERRAFVKSVFEKLPAEQEELQWTEAALAEDDRYRRLSHLVTWVDALLLISVIGLGVAWVRMLMGRG